MKACKNLLVAGVFGFLFPAQVVAQNITEMMLEGMAKEGASRAEEMLKRAPDQLQEYLEEKNRSFETEQQCLSELQLLTNAGAIVSNVMPFSSVWAYETNGTMRTRLRLMVTGQRLHTDFSCEGAVLVGKMLDWSAPVPSFPALETDTLSAALGAFLILSERDQFAQLDATDSGTERLQACGVNSPSTGVIGGPFRLTNAEGFLVSDQEVITRPSLLYFGYTSSPDVTPIDLTRNVQVVDLLRENGHIVKPVFISIDPQRDTPSVVGSFVSGIDDDLIGLTGQEDQVKAASQAYRTYFRRQNNGDTDYLVDHSTFTYLVLPGTGFVEFFRREISAEDMAGKVACIIETEINRDAVPTDEIRDEISSPDEIATEIATALDYALSETELESTSAPPLTQGERDHFRTNVQYCWVVDIDSPSADVTVTVGFEMDTEGRVIGSTLELLNAEGGDSSAIEEAFQAARRAILRCQGDGYRLPSPQTGDRTQVELTFDPESVIVR